MVIDEVGVRQQAEQRWNSDPAIRAEFLSKESYVAYCVADAKGLVKLHAPKAQK